tara:strand:+ start:796 stop:1275 length:480 start_codon:yes stop_codon:yes gene_type:complete
MRKPFKLRSGNTSTFKNLGSEDVTIEHTATGDAKHDTGTQFNPEETAYVKDDKGADRTWFQTKNEKGETKYSLSKVVPDEKTELFEGKDLDLIRDQKFKEWQENNPNATNDDLANAMANINAELDKKYTVRYPDGKPNPKKRQVYQSYYTDKDEKKIYY